MASLSPSAPAARAIPLDRERLFLWLFPIAVAGWAGAAFNLFGISAILWVALAAGLQLLRAAPEGDPATRRDWVVAGAGLLTIALPSATISSGALTVFALYALATGASASPLRRAAIIFLAVSGTTLWGPLVLALFNHPLLDLDAFFVARVAGVAQEGNLIAFADGSGLMAVAPGCSSLQGISLALVFWATVNQWFQVPIGGRSLAWLGAAVAATVTVNVSRIAALSHFPAHFDSIHAGIGWHVASWTTMMLVAAICVYGARREIFG